VRLVVYFWRLSRRSNSRAMGKSSEKGVSIKTLALGSPCQLLNGLYFPHGGCTVRYPAERDADGTVRNFISLAHRSSTDVQVRHVIVFVAVIYGYCRMSPSGLAV